MQVVDGAHCDAFDVPVVDTLGAGDAYNAGFITAAVEGLSLAEANRRGNAVAAWKIMHREREISQPSGSWFNW